MPKLSLTEVVTFLAHLFVTALAAALVAINPGLTLSPDQQVAATGVVGAYLLTATAAILHHVRWLRSSVTPPVGVVVGTPVNANQAALVPLAAPVAAPVAPPPA